jgi:FkbM family methyltransferase
MRRILQDPANPAWYGSAPTLRFSVFEPTALARMAKRFAVLDPGNGEARNHFGNAMRLHWGRQIRQSVQPQSRETKSVTFGDTTLRFQSGRGPSQAFFERVVVGDKLHEAGLLAYLHSNVREGDLLVDIGAHIGYVSCFGAAFGATVLAMEMQPTLVPVISANALMNDLWTVHPINAAAGSGPGLVQSMRFDPSPGLMTHSERVQHNDFPSSSVNHDLIPRLAVDDLALAGHAPPAFVKVDVEGAEALVVKGCRRLIEGERTRFLVEIHPDLLATFGSTLDDILGAFPGPRWSARLLREDGSADAVAPSEFAREAVWDNNYMIVFEPRTMGAKTL